MGWTYLYKHPEQSARDFLVKHFSESTEENEYHVLRCSMVGTTAYLAQERQSKVNPKDRVVFARVVLTHRDKESHNNFGFKEMTEYDGPAYQSCPIGVLTALTPLPALTDTASDELRYAHAWRKACRANIEHKKSCAKLLVKNATFKLEPALSLKDGSLLDTLQVFSISPFKLMCPTRNALIKGIGRTRLEDYLKSEKAVALHLPT